MSRLIPLLAITALVSACATVPDPLAGEFSEVTPDQARQEGLSGQAVRWGGEIVEVRPLADRTCLEILSRKLGRSARPTGGDAGMGRFIACKSGFIDPAEFAQGREVTVAGRLAGLDTGSIGEFEYRFPRVEARSVYLWPERRDYDDRRRYHGPYPYFYDPFFWPYPYRHPFWYHPYGFHGGLKGTVESAGES